jgi:hypothetical protein
MSNLDKLLVEAVSGAVIGEKLTVRKRGDKTYLAKQRKADKNRVPTPAQEQFREDFAAATIYAGSAMASPELKKLYDLRATGNSTGFNVALKDYLKPPRVKTIDVGKYNGTPGSTILVRAIDNFRVKEVKVSIYNAAGDLVEEGQALLDPVVRVKWIYTALQVIAQLPGCKIKAVAQDLPGNSGELEITL